MYCLLAVTYSRPAASHHVWRLTGRVPVCAVLVAVVETAVCVEEEGAGWSQGSTEGGTLQGGREGGCRASAKYASTRLCPFYLRSRLHHGHFAAYSLLT